MPLPVETEADTASVVLIGSFNPAIFQPMWFAAQEMLSREDAEAAEVSVIHNDLTQFRARQIRVTVEQNRFVVGCEYIHRNLVRDLVLSCFGRVLVHCPIQMMGINRELHFSCGSEPNRSAFGFAIAPLEPWGLWGAEIGKEIEDNKPHGGMMSLQMRQSPRPGDRIGYIQAEIQPSKLVRNNAGIFVRVNDHFEFEVDKEHPTQNAMEALESEWEGAAKKAEYILSDIMAHAAGKK
jgi:hypothetical protein